MALSQASPFRLIMGNIRQQLINCTGISNTLIRVTANPNYDISYPNDRFLVIVYSGIIPDDSAGIGRRARPCVRNITIFIYTRSNLDLYGDDLHALLDEYSHSDFEESIFSALDQYWPYADGSNLSIEPIQTVSSTAEGVPFRQNPDDSEGLVRSELSFSVKYVANSTTAVPLPPAPPVDYPE